MDKQIVGGHSGTDPGFLERGVNMYKGAGAHFDDFILFSSPEPKAHG